MPLDLVHTAELARAQPWREFRWHRGQQHYSGIYWSATIGGHVVYESRLELSRLILADFDPGTVAIASQPFLLEQDARRHVPDFLLIDAVGVVTVVNVKPAERLSRPKVKEALEWAAALFQSRGWRSEIWSGASYGHGHGQGPGHRPPPAPDVELAAHHVASASSMTTFTGGRP